MTGLTARLISSDLFRTGGSPQHVAMSGDGPLGPSPESIRILLVDDDALLVACQAAVLENFGHEVTAVSDPHHALALVGAHPGYFDIVITDLVMPELDGLELSARLNSLRPDLPIIMLTGTPPRKAELGYGIRKLLTKPAPSREVHEAIHEVLAGARVPRSAKQQTTSAGERRG